MRRKLPAALFAIPVTFFFVGAFYLHLLRDIFPSTTTSSTLPIIQSTHHRQNLAVREHPSTLRRLPPSPSTTQSLLLPDWELLLLPHSPPPTTHNLSCLFHNGRLTPALLGGATGSASPTTFRCSIPPSVRRLRPLLTPHLVSSDNPIPPSPSPTLEILRWNRPHVYATLSTPTDVIVFAKGVNNRQGVNRRAADLLCVYLAAGATAATTAVTSSAQEVFRCPHPQPHLDPTTPTTVTIKFRNANATFPSLATYRRQLGAAPLPPRAKVCACTMVLNAAKFLREWVVYHASIGVERFILYDNGSEDDLAVVVDRLTGEGFNVSTRFWPWPKTQEAGFSHCAAVEVGACEWMAFIDVDEFVFSPDWSGSVHPNRAMIPALLPSEPAVGQVSMHCRDFGPSGQRAHPSGGVTQGYTCRRRVEERHKSIIRLEAVDRSLVNSVHHFALAEGRRMRRGAAVVNHYKYQAWEEFKVKFRRRVSAYVVDWREAANEGSRDRTPGLGFEAVEPKGWAGKFCEVNDTRLRDTTRRWFGEEGGGGRYKMVWEM